MTIIQIVQYTSEGATPHNVSFEEEIQQLIGESVPYQLVIGTQVNESNVVQLLLEENSTSGDDTDAGAFVKSLQDSFGTINTSFSVEVNSSPFLDENPATEDVVEYVTTWFPASQATPEFRQKIESDFMRFNEIVMRDAEGRIGLSIGWVVEEQDIEQLKNEKAVAFFTLAGWKSVQHFEKATKTESFKEAAAIVMGWNAPYKMVRIL